MNKRRVRRGGKKFVRPEKGKYKAKNSLPGLRAPNWNNLTLQPFEKKFYREHPNVMNRLRQDVERFRNKHEISVQGLALNPIETFDEVFMPDYVAREIQNQGYSRPTPIQCQTWPIAFSGYNLVGIAQTGSGKTLAYILPAIIHINNQENIKPGDGPIAVVLAPTRELAVQIQQVAIDFGTSTHIRTVCTVGGVDKKPQESDLLKGCEIVVATPGRLLDFLSTNVTNMRRCTYLVLDEADRMLDMGFEAQIREIISQIRPDKQILMWSATWPHAIRQLAEDFLGDYIQVNIGSLELSANHNIKQFVHICQENEKSSKLQLLLRQIYQANNPGKILIFVAKKKRADMISKYINNFGVACESLHGDKPQSQRTKILDDFRSGRSNIIVATDVAARGLDVDGIMYVINLDFPKLIEDYVHRIGRCGRCDRMGISYAFFTLNDAKQAKELIAILNEANQPVDAKLQEIAYNPKKPPEKIDKKLRRLNENSGFDVPSQEKRPHSSRNTNFDGAGPSSTCVRETPIEEPAFKRGRTNEPEPAERNVMFNSNRDFREERDMNRGFINRDARNLNTVEDNSMDRRRMADRNIDIFQADGRNDRAFMDSQSLARRHVEDNRRIDLDRMGGRIDLDRMGGRNDLDRMGGRMDHFTVDIDRMVEERGRLGQRPANLTDDFRMAKVTPNDLDVRRFDGSGDFARGEPAIGLDRMRIPNSDFDPRENGFSRSNDFLDAPTDRVMRDYFDDIQRPVRDNLRGGMNNDIDQLRPVRDMLRVGVNNDIDQLGPMFNSSVADRRNYEPDFIDRDNRDIFSTKASNFQDALNYRTYDSFPERAIERGISQEPRHITPDRILDRSNDIADMFLNQSRDDDAFDSMQNFGSRRGDRAQVSRFDMGDRRNNFVDDSNEPEWNNFSSRNEYQQNRREFNDGAQSHRRNDFNLDRQATFNRNNDFEDEFRNRNRRDFDRRNIDNRFNRFN